MTPEDLQRAMQDFIAQQDDDTLEEWYTTKRDLYHVILQRFAKTLGIDLPD